MKIQKSFVDENPSLYLVATPIGNLNEMTPRAIEILKSVDCILCEDTRTSQKLLSHFEIKTPLLSYHMHNEKSRSEMILKRLDEGESLALISDAGYPLISDPGQVLVNEVVAHDYAVIPITGSSAFLNALVASGQVVQPFTFMGFMENKTSQLKQQIEDIENVPHTLIFYVSVHKIENSIQVLYDILGNRQVTLAREITKRHEEFIRTDLKSLCETELTLKGEFVLVLEGNTTKEVITIDSLLTKVTQEIEDGLSPSRAISKVSKDHHFSKNELYQAYQSRKEVI